MTTLLKSVSDAYDDYIASGDPRVTSWMIAKSPVPTFTIAVLYVLFVKKIGPAWMTNKKPFDLCYTMFVYNFVMVFTYIFLIYETVRIKLKLRHNWLCCVEPDDPNNPDEISLIYIGFFSFFLKFVEFADTIFFVLRKKSQQISTLHVVHHALVPIFLWFGCRIRPVSYAYFFLFINGIVHTVMYSYYGLAALGPSVQRYLWWKKYLTILQIIQFVIVFFYLLLITTTCKVSKTYIFLCAFVAGLFLIMFYDYFQKTYLKTKVVKKQKYIGAANKAANGKKIS